MSGILQTALGTFTIPAPTVDDYHQVAVMMRELARKKMPTPSAVIAAAQPHLAPAMLEMFIKQVAALALGGNVKPTDDLEVEQYTTEDGLALRLYYHIAKTAPGFDVGQAELIVKREGRWVIAEKLEAALAPKKSDPGEGPPTGTTPS